MDLIRACKAADITAGLPSVPRVPASPASLASASPPGLEADYATRKQVLGVWGLLFGAQGSGLRLYSFPVSPFGVCGFSFGVYSLGFGA